MLFGSNRLVYFISEVPNAFACGESGQNVPKADRIALMALSKELSMSDELSKGDEGVMLDRLAQAVAGNWRVDMSKDGKVRNCVTADTKLTSYLRDNIDVLFLQKLLKKAGYDPGDLDGILGDKTLLAVYKFQKANGLSPDSIFGPLTFAKLKEVVTGEAAAAVAPVAVPAPAVGETVPEDREATHDDMNTVSNEIWRGTNYGQGKKVLYWDNVKYGKLSDVKRNQPIVTAAINNVFNGLTETQKGVYGMSGLRGIILGVENRGVTISSEGNTLYRATDLR